MSKTPNSPLLPHPALDAAFERAFYRLDDPLGVSIVFGLYATDGRGTTPAGCGEAELRWQLSGQALGDPALIVYRDVWPLLPALCDLQQRLADLPAGTIVLPAEFAQLLINDGFSERSIDEL